MGCKKENIEEEEKRTDSDVNLSRLAVKTLGGWKRSR